MNFLKHFSNLIFFIFVVSWIEIILKWSNMSGKCQNKDIIGRFIFATPLCWTVFTKACQSNQGPEERALNCRLVTKRCVCADNIFSKSTMKNFKECFNWSCCLLELLPKLDERSRIFELDPCDGYGKVCLVYRNTKAGLNEQHFQISKDS